MSGQACLSVRLLGHGPVASVTPLGLSAIRHRVVINGPLNASLIESRVRILECSAGNEVV